MENLKTIKEAVRDLIWSHVVSRTDIIKAQDIAIDIEGILKSGLNAKEYVAKYKREPL